MITAAGARGVPLLLPRDSPEAADAPNAVITRQVANDKQHVSQLEAKVKAYLTAGDRETAAKFALEMQKAKQNYFKDRSIYYSTFPIQEQGLKGDWYFDLKAVYTIGILDFVFDEDKHDINKFIYAPH